MQRILFKIGNLFVFLLLLAHLYNNRNGLPIPVIDSESRTLTTLMKTYKIHYSGGIHTLDETLWGYDLTWAMFVVFVFLINIVVLRFRPRTSPLLKHASLAQVVLWVGAAAAAFAFWSIPQQSIFSLLAVIFGAAYLSSPRKPSLKPTRVAVIGGGVAGLTAAYQLKKRGYHHVTVFEKEDKVGGKCLSFDYENDAFDMGGHEMLGAYTDIITMAEEVGAATKTTIPPLIYDSKNKKYLNFVESVSISGFSKMKVMKAAIRYWWMAQFRYRKFARPQLGFADMPEELMLPLEEWLKVKKLEPLENIIDFVIKVQGYGATKEISAAYFVKFMSPKNWSSLILSGVKITNKWPKVFVEGMQNFWEKVATNFTVKTNTKVVKIQRNAQNPQAPIEVWIENQEKSLCFDKLIIACPLDPKTIQFLDIDAQEKALFEQIQTIPFTSTACLVKGLPAGVVATIPFNDIANGEYTGYIKDYQADEMAIFFSILPEGKDGAHIVEKTKKVLQDIPAYNGQKPELLGVHLQRIWEYFPHVSPEAQKKGFYKQIEALQGQKNTYFVGSLFSFEIVGNTAAYSKALVEKNF